MIKTGFSITLSYGTFHKRRIWKSQAVKPREKEREWTESKKKKIFFIHEMLGKPKPLMVIVGSFYIHPCHTHNPVLKLLPSFLSSERHHDFRIDQKWVELIEDWYFSLLFFSYNTYFFFPSVFVKKNWLLMCLMVLE